MTLATHLDHFISSTDKKSTVKSAKSCFWRSFNMFMSDIGQLSYTVKCKLFNQYCCSFYGSPLWSLKSTIVEYMCVDLRKALRSLWRVDPRTHCDLITAVSNQIQVFSTCIHMYYFVWINIIIYSSYRPYYLLYH